MVFNTGQYIDSLQIVVIIRFKDEATIINHHLRGPSTHRAGNFSRWLTCLEVLQDPTIFEAFIDDVRETISLGLSSNGVCIPCGSTVGWSRADRIERYCECDLEDFSPTPESRGLRVAKAACEKLTAPKTDKVTIVYHVSNEPCQFVVFVSELYPGQDVGNLVGEVSVSRDQVFFDWHHQGES